MDAAVLIDDRVGITDRTHARRPHGVDIVGDCLVHVANGDPVVPNMALRSALDGFTATSNQFWVSGRNSIRIRVPTTDAANTTSRDIDRLPVNGVRGPVELGQFATLEQTHSDFDPARESLAES